MVERRCCLGRRLGRSALRGREARRRRRPLRGLERDCRLGLVDSRSPLDLGRGGDLAGFHGWVWVWGWEGGVMIRRSVGPGAGAPLVVSRDWQSVSVVVPPGGPATHGSLGLRLGVARTVEDNTHAPVFESASRVGEPGLCGPRCLRLVGPKPPRPPGLETAAGAGGCSLRQAAPLRPAAATGRESEEADCSTSRVPWLRPRAVSVTAGAGDRAAAAFSGSACGAAGDPAVTLHTRQYTRCGFDHSF